MSHILKVEHLTYKEIVKVFLLWTNTGTNLYIFIVTSLLDTKYFPGQMPWSLLNILSVLSQLAFFMFSNFYVAFLHCLSVMGHFLTS